MEVHKHLGQGLRADAYRNCLAHELRLREIMFEQQVPLSINYKGRDIDAAATIDFVVEGTMVLKIEAVDELIPKHKSELNNLLRLTGLESGFLINFNVEKLRDGIKRLIVSAKEPPVPYQ